MQSLPRIKQKQISQIIFRQNSSVILPKLADNIEAARTDIRNRAPKMSEVQEGETEHQLVSIGFNVGVLSVVILGCSRR